MTELSGNYLGMIGNYALNDLWIVRKFWRMLANYGGMIGNYLGIISELWRNDR